MKETINKLTKIKVIVALVFPLLHLVICLPIWNGKEYPMEGLGWYLSVIYFGVALLNFFLVFFKRKVRVQGVFNLFLILSFFNTFLVGTFFVGELMGIPPFPPQD